MAGSQCHIEIMNAVIGKMHLPEMTVNYKHNTYKLYKLIALTILLTFCNVLVVSTGLAYTIRLLHVTTLVFYK